jgi:diketogulonate reductase-like aldo/keto reductase
MVKSITDCVILNNGVKMPWLGFGVFQVDDGSEVEGAVKAALNTGYRSIDTAAAYKNERGVGKAIRDSGIPREEIFLTTKVWNSDQRKRRPLDAFEESLDRLGVEYVDLYLVHWPVEGFYQDTWGAMEEIYGSGRAKSVGVSNFMIPHLEKILADCQVVPAVNQVEFHPYLFQEDLLAYCRDHEIQLEAWSPLMKGRIIDDPTLLSIAEKHHKTPAQVSLRWVLQHQVVAIPKSVHPNRIAENAGVFDFSLSEEDMSTLDGLGADGRVGPDPFNFDF